LPKVKEKTMKSLKTLVAALSFTLVFGVTVFAGEPTVPCNPDPGITSTPPCASAQMTPEESSAPTDTPTSSNPVDEYSVSEIAIDLIQYWLSIY
jgi:hypothetical protein